MVETILSHLTVLGAVLLTLGLGWFAWFMSGVGNMAIKDTLKNWSWARTGKDILKVIGFSISMVACSVTTDVLSYFVDKLEIAQLTAFMDTISWGVIIVIPIVATMYLVYRALKNNKSWLNYSQITKEMGLPEEIDVTDNSKEIAEKIYSLFEVPEDLAEKHADFEKQVEEEGGLGAHYSVSISSYDAFRNTVNGKGYDCDGYYGAQCWDGADLLWMQLGRFLSTGGTGAAKGCWANARNENAGSDFTLISNKSEVKRGDVVVFGSGAYGHIGFADEDYDGGAYIRLLGQNQGGVAYPSGGSNFNVVNVSMASFLGAFRYKKWVVAPTPTPTPTPTPAPTPSNFKVGDNVTLTNYVDYNGTPLVKTHDYYTISQLSGDRAVLNWGNAVYAAVNTKNLAKYTGSVTPTPAPATFNVGDTVIPTKLVDYNGTPLVQYDPTYTITQISGDRAVLSARGSVWAAMNTANIRKA